MRLFLIAASIAASVSLSLPGVVLSADAAECSGSDCPPPTGQDGQSGHDCDRKKNEQTTS